MATSSDSLILAMNIQFPFDEIKSFGFFVMYQRNAVYVLGLFARGLGI